MLYYYTIPSANDWPGLRVDSDVDIQTVSCKHPRTLSYIHATYMFLSIHNCYHFIRFMKSSMCIMFKLMSKLIIRNQLLVETVLKHINCCVIKLNVTNLLKIKLVHRYFGRIYTCSFIFEAG